MRFESRRLAAVFKTDDGQPSASHLVSYRLIRAGQRHFCRPTPSPSIPAGTRPHASKMRPQRNPTNGNTGAATSPSRLNPGSAAKLAEQYFSGHGGLPDVRNAQQRWCSPRPGPWIPLFYGSPETGFADYDFKHMFDRWAHWTAVAMRLYLDVCDLTAPVLGWPEWDATAAATGRRLPPLADEAEKRYEEPIRRTLARIP